MAEPYPGLGGLGAPLSAETRATQERTEYRAALLVAAEVHGLGPDTTWVDLVRLEASRAEETRLRESALDWGLQPDAPLDVLRAADHARVESLLADLRVRRPTTGTQPAVELTAEQVATQERYRQELITQLDLPANTSIEDAQAARSFAHHEVNRQSHIRNLNLDPRAATPAQIAEAEAARNAASAARRQASIGTGPPHEPFLTRL